MAAAVPLIGPLLGLAGSLFGGGSDEPEAPAPVAAPAPPAPPPPPNAVDPQESINAEQERIRGLRRRRSGSEKSLTSLSTTSSSSKKTLLGE